MRKGAIKAKLIDNKKVIYSFKPEMAFVEKGKTGETFKVKTNDCFFGQIKMNLKDILISMIQW